MIVEIIVSIIAGIIIGTFTGITPGIHINTVTAILVANLGIFASVSTFALISFVVSLAMTHTVLDFIPSILTGATDSESFLSVLPGHELLKEGKGKEAVLLVLIGIITSIPLIAIISPIFIKVVPLLYQKIIYVIPFLLIFISIYTIAREEKVWTALSIFIATGLLGYASLNSPVKEPLLPLLGGLFGGSSIIISLSQKTKIPKQDSIKLPKFKEIKKDYFKSIIGSIISSPLCSFLPGIGSGHAATISSEIVPQSRKSFLMMLGTINILVMVLSFTTLYLLNKTRTGAAAAIKSIAGDISSTQLLNIMIISIITIVLTSFVAIFLTNLFLKIIEKIDYSKISIIMLLILIIAIIILSNWHGFLIFLTSTAWGIFAILSNVRRINMMGVLLIPTILIYLTNQF